VQTDTAMEFIKLWPNGYPNIQPASQAAKTSNMRIPNFVY